MSEPGKFVQAEIASQPQIWRAVGERWDELVGGGLWLPGERVALVGCGTSWFISAAAAALREASGAGEADAFTAAEFPHKRIGVAGGYDRVIALTRSGTTTEVLQLLAQVRGRVPTLAITGTPTAPVATAADQLVDLGFADEQSVVQTRFATAALTLFRAALGADITSLADDAERALVESLPPSWADCEQITFLGQNWTVGLAHEAALKFRESSASWAESYPALDYRHGPISIAAPKRLVWCFGPPPPGLQADVERAGAAFITSNLDPQADLIRAQRVAIDRALKAGLNPDQPRHLARSVILN